MVDFIGSCSPRIFNDCNPLFHIQYMLVVIGMLHYITFCVEMFVRFQFLSVGVNKMTKIKKEKTLYCGECISHMQSIYV